MSTTKRYPLGARVTPHIHLNTRPLADVSEAPTWPSLSAMPSPAARSLWHRPRRSWLAVRWDGLRWWLVDLWLETRYHTGWVGEIVLLVVCALLFLLAGVGLGVLIGWWLWLAH